MSFKQRVREEIWHLAEKSDFIPDNIATLFRGYFKLVIL